MKRPIGRIRFHRFVIKNFGSRLNSDSLHEAKPVQAAAAISVASAGGVAPPVAGGPLPIAPPLAPAAVVPQPGAKAGEQKPAAQSGNEPKIPEPVLPENCGLKAACPAGQYSYLVRSGAGKTQGPTICFNGNYIVSAERNPGQRGITVVTIDEKTLKVQKIQIFDVYISDEELLTFMKYPSKSNHFLLAASFDEASFKLTSAGRKAFRPFAITMIEKADFRDSYAVIGQRGLMVKEAIEMLETKKDNNGYAFAAEVSGCVSNPMGKLTGVNNVQDGKSKIQSPKTLDSESKNCGVPTPCSADSFSIRLYSGVQNKEGVKICFDGKYVMTAELNDGGRGLNFVVIDSKTKSIIHVSRFDTFANDGSTVEMFIEMLNIGDIVLAVAHDEASDKLDAPVRAAMEAIGSSFFHMLSFRDVWAFVTQKGMTGFSPIEEFEYSGSDKAKGILSWPKPIDLKTCVPTKLVGLPKKREILRNWPRRDFCHKYDGHAEFCDDEHIDLAIIATKAIDQTLKDHEIYKVPIILVTGLNHHAARLQLEGLFANPGIDISMITVYFDEKFEEAGALAKLFGVASNNLPSSVKYTALIEKALHLVWKKNPSSKYVIVLEEEVIPTPDFLNFIRQTLKALQADETLIGISAWNNNGYAGVSGPESMAYRAVGFPGLGFLLKKTFYDKHMDGQMIKCCAQRSWEGWFKELSPQMIIPAVSRVTRGHYDGRASDLLKELFNRPRQTVGSNLITLSNVESLTADKYENELEKLITSAKQLDDKKLQECLASKTGSFALPDLPKDTVYVVFYEQSSAGDQKTLSQLCRCFKLFHVDGQDMVRDVHNGIVRFGSKDGGMILLVGSKTVYDKHKPANVLYVKIALSGKPQES